MCLCALTPGLCLPVINQSELIRPRTDTDATQQAAGVDGAGMRQ